MYSKISFNRIYQFHGRDTSIVILKNAISLQERGNYGSLQIPFIFFIIICVLTCIVGKDSGQVFCCCPRDILHLDWLPLKTWEPSYSCREERWIHALWKGISVQNDWLFSIILNKEKNCFILKVAQSTLITDMAKKWCLVLVKFCEVGEIDNFSAPLIVIN